jgi:hypothetical protein
VRSLRRGSVPQRNWQAARAKPLAGSYSPTPLRRPHPRLSRPVLTERLHHKTFVQNESTSGSWSDNRTWPQGVGLFSTTSDSTLTLVTTGGPIYLWYRIQDSNGGTFTYALDGSAPTTINTAPTTPISTQNGGVIGRGVVRLPGVSAGTHTVSKCSDCPHRMRTDRPAAKCWLPTRRSRPAPHLDCRLRASADGKPDRLPYIR